jgi:hypothetical protein
MNDPDAVIRGFFVLLMEFVLIALIYSQIHRATENKHLAAAVVLCCFFLILWKML